MQWRPHTPMMRFRWNTWYQGPGSWHQVPVSRSPLLRCSFALRWGNLWSLWQIWWRSRAMLVSTLLNVFETEKHCHCPTWQKTHTHFWMKNENNAIYKTLNEMSSESQKPSVRCYCFQLAKIWKLHWENMVTMGVINRVRLTFAKMQVCNLIGY